MTFKPYQTGDYPSNMANVTKCLLFVSGETCGDSVSQTEGTVTLPEGALLTLKCTYQTSYTEYLFWYVQYQNKEPELLLKSSSGNKVNRGFKADLVKSDRSFHLQKPSVQASDSAVYYCALRDTVREAAAGAVHKPRGLPWASMEQPGYSRSCS